MKIITSWDDGNKLDLRIAELLLKYELRGIFFIPTIGCELSVDEIEKLSLNFQIGGHTTSHPQDIKMLSDEDAMYDIRDNKEWLEEIINNDIQWFCYPRGRYNESTIEIIKDLGFLYARTTLVGNTDICENDYRIHPSVHVAKHRKEYKGTPWLEYAIKQYKIAKNKDNSYYHIWGHSWEIESQNLWEELEELFKFIYGDQNNRSNNHTSKTE